METITALVLSVLLLLSAAKNAPTDLGLPKSAPAPTDSPLQEESGTGTVKKRINIYSTPNSGSQIVGQLEIGNRVEVLRSMTTGTTKWYCIFSPDQAILGLVRADAIALPNPPAVQKQPEVIPANAKKGIVTTTQLNIRSLPDKNSKRLGAYLGGDRVAILETSGNWGRTTKGWISMSYVYLDGTPGRYAMTGYVTASQLNVRSGPGTGTPAPEVLPRVSRSRFWSRSWLAPPSGAAPAPVGSA